MIERVAPGEAVVWGMQPGAHVLEVRALLNDGSVSVAMTRFEVRQ
jgi:hypothetical protein